MDSAATLSAPKVTARASELSALLNEYASSLKILSLDCFDTLLWRKTATPSDAFYDMSQLPTFTKLGISARTRAQAENVARQRMLLNYGCTEVTLNDIYRALFPHLSTEELQHLAEEELATEIATCYAFPPVVELIREAHTRGLKIIIVSDTYLTEKQLRALLAKTLPSDVLPLIMKIFCSSENGRSKAHGLFNNVLDTLNTAPRAILHIGDHQISDLHAAQSMNLHAVQLIQLDQTAGDLMRMQALAAGMLDSSIRHKRGLVSPYRGVLATADITSDNPPRAIGYASLGPIMYAFGRFICDEIEQMKREGKRPKVLFLLRDAYLPSKVCEILAGCPIGTRVRISRFAAFASSFRTREDIDNYLMDTVVSLRFFDICKQLLLPEKLAARLSKDASKGKNPALEFIRLVHEEEILNVIYAASKKYRTRLLNHLQKEIDLQSGDTLVFVDLGYTGTAQIKLEPVLRDELNIDVVGRYLIALRTPGWESTRRGLLDPSWCDDRLLLTLTTYIALLEQLSTSNEKSVVDYADNGDAIYSDTTVGVNQHDKLGLIQAECLRFIQDADHFYKKSGTHISTEILRDVAMAELGRLLFIPSKHELDYLQTFQFDLNLGTKDLLNVFDEEKGLTGLRRRGLFFMEKNLKSMRTNYPAELRSAGLELALTLLSQHRLGFDIRVHDLSLRRERVSIIVMKGGKSSQPVLEAMPTHDGFFALLIPVGACDFQVGIQFGLYYQWLQLESADLIVSGTLFGSTESQHTKDVMKELIKEQMVEKKGGLYECTSKAALLIFSPPAQKEPGRYVLRVVFRPIAGRE